MHSVLNLSYVCVLVVFFFCKQKTAYELRISDWSSDVCSSDFFRGRRRRGEEAGAEHARRDRRDPPLDRQPRDRGERAGHRNPVGGRTVEPRRGAVREERKSVGEGTGGSGRVDPAGRRICKKKYRYRHSRDGLK